MGRHSDTTFAAPKQRLRATAWWVGAPPAAGRRLWSDSRLAQTTKPWRAEGAGLSPGQGPPCSNQSSQQVKPQKGATTEPGNPCAHTPYCTLRISLWEPQEGKPLGQDSRTPDPFWPQGSGVSHGPDANTWSRQGCKSKPPPPNQRHRPDPGTVKEEKKLDKFGTRVVESIADNKNNLCKDTDIQQISRSFDDYNSQLLPFWNS